jgi:hypothetical protein
MVVDISHLRSNTACIEWEQGDRDILFPFLFGESRRPDGYSRDLWWGIKSCSEFEDRKNAMAWLARRPAVGAWLVICVMYDYIPFSILLYWYEKEMDALLKERDYDGLTEMDKIVFLRIKRKVYKFYFSKNSGNVSTIKLS